MDTTPITSSSKKAMEIKGQFDVVSPGAKKLRRKPQIETTEETGEGSKQLPPMSRLMLLNLCRDAQRNFSLAKNVINQFGLNVIGTEFKLRLRMKHDRKSPTDPMTIAENWFNKIWAPNAEFRSGLHLCEFNNLTIKSVVREGDTGMLFDADWAQSGKLLAFESDQIATPSDAKDKKVWHDGVLTDGYGREIGYFATSKRGLNQATLSDGAVYKRDPVDESKNNFKLLRMPWRHNQKRGVPEIAAIVADMLDIYEMRTKEMQTAKVNASMAGAVTRDAAKAGALLTDSRLDPNVSQKDAEGTEKPAVESTYKRFESLAGGYFEYLDKGEKVDWYDPKRPNVNFEAFNNFIAKSAGSGVGLAKCYTLLEASTSYTAFRGELIMTWVMFHFWQKWAERNIRDWQAVRAIRWGIKIGVVPALPEGWELSLGWNSPRMPSVNPLVDQQTFLAELKNGTTSWQKELGPEYEEIFEELVEGLGQANAKKLPLAIFETKSGGIVDQSGNNVTTDDEAEKK